MEEVPSMDDILDELEEAVKGTSNHATHEITVYDKGPSLPCASLSVTKELQDLPFSVPKKDEAGPTERVLSPHSHSLNNISHSPTPSEVHDFHDCEVPHIGSVQPLPKLDDHSSSNESIKITPETNNTIPKVKLFAQPISTEQPSEIHTEDPEFQEVLAYLDQCELKQAENEVDVVKESPSLCNGGEEISSESSKPPVEDMASHLQELDVSTASNIPSSQIPNDVASCSYVELVPNGVLQESLPGEVDNDSSNDSLPEDERATLQDNSVCDASASTCSLGPPLPINQMDSSTESSAEESHENSSTEDVLSQSASSGSDIEMDLKTSLFEDERVTPCSSNQDVPIQSKQEEYFVNHNIEKASDHQICSDENVEVSTERDGECEKNEHNEAPISSDSFTQHSREVFDIDRPLQPQLATEPVADAIQLPTVSEGDSNIAPVSVDAPQNEVYEANCVSLSTLGEDLEAKEEDKPVCIDPVQETVVVESIVEMKKDDDFLGVQTNLPSNDKDFVEKSLIRENSEREESMPKQIAVVGELVKEKKKKRTKPPKYSKLPKVEATIVEASEALQAPPEEITVKVENTTEVKDDEVEEAVQEDFPLPNSVQNTDDATELTAQQVISILDPNSTDFEESQSVASSRQRFQDEVIATVHDMAEESDPNRLTESELQLGKTKPYWIPDEDCANCMLCATKFSILYRRHHCRACGRVLCGSCCKEKATLVYMGDDEKKNKGRVCPPCLTMLQRIQVYESSLTSSEDGESSQVGAIKSRGVLKSRPPSNDCEDEAGSSRQSGSQDGVTETRRRSVVFRDGLRPGEATSPVNNAEERSAIRAIKKKSPRKRVAVARRLASLKLEEELQSALPDKDRERVFVKNGDGALEELTIEEIDIRLLEKTMVQIILKRNLSAFIQLCSHPTDASLSIWCVSSKGFSAIGVDEVVFLWGKDENEPIALPIGVLERISEMFESGLEGDQLGIRRSCDRLPTLHTTHLTDIKAPCTRHVLIFRPNSVEVSSLSVAWPSEPFVVGCFVQDEEMVWALAAPNRLLLRLGLLSGWYPTPLINDPKRPPVFTNETGQTVLKVFTDFRNWNYRMQHLHGSTVSLSSTETVIRLPISAKLEIRSIIEWNKCMLAWSCDLNGEADSHLVCVEDAGMYNTQVLSRQGTRNSTGASFVIVDGGLKTPGEKVQISVMEDGVAIRMSGDDLGRLIGALQAGTDWSLAGISNGVRFEWMDPAPPNAQLISPIDGIYLGDKFQYGLSLSRAITTALQCPSCSENAVRLSHVFNIEMGRFEAEEEAKIFSVAEMLAREATSSLDPYLQLLINMNTSLIAIRFRVCPDAVEYDVSPWCGLEEEQANFRQQLDQMVPILVNILNFLHNGFHLELHLSIVSTASLPI